MAEVPLAARADHFGADHAVRHVAVLLAYACSAYYVALVLTRRRLLR